MTLENAISPLLGFGVSGGDVVRFAAAGVLWMILGIVPLLLLCAVIFYGLSGVMRREERSRFFLEFLLTAQKQGRGIERALVELSQQGERSLGPHVDQLASELTSGASLGEALEKTPRFLVPQLAAALSMGSQAGDLSEFLVACRGSLWRGSSRMLAGCSTMIVSLIAIPAGLGALWLGALLVIPRFKAMA